MKVIKHYPRAPYSTLCHARTAKKGNRHEMSISLKGNRPLKCVAFDIGGVLEADYWQSIILDETRGLAKALGLNRDVTRRVCDALWRKHYLRESTEDEYWRDFQAELGKRPTQGQIQIAEQSIWIERDFPKILKHCHDRRIAVCIVTENTSFWLPKQKTLLTSLDLVPRQNVFASYMYGIGKKSRSNSLYNLLEEKFDSTRTLVLDDDPKNLKNAALLGFTTLQYFGLDNPTPNLLPTIQNYIS